MFIINLTYKVDLNRVDKYIDAHITFLNQQYEKRYFHVSGRKVPRTGGIILAKCSSKEHVLEIIEKDPFKIHDLAAYDIIEFIPTKSSESLLELLN